MEWINHKGVDSPLLWGEGMGDERIKEGFVKELSPSWGLQ